MLHDLTAELLWPRILRAPALALRPSRVMLGMVAVFIASLIGQLSTLWSDKPAYSTELSKPLGEIFAQAADSITQLSATGLFNAVKALAMLPGTLLLDRPVDTVVLGLPIVLVFVLFGGAISRAVATEFATTRITDWPADLRTSISKLGWSVGATIAPLAIAGVLVGAITLGGSSLGVPVLNIAGAILYSVALVFALLAIFILALHALALPMIVPALMCEGTDGYDAAQRSYAYILAHPLRLLSHGAILLVLGAVSIWIVAGVAINAIDLTNWAAAEFAGDSGAAVLLGGEGLAATQPIAHEIIRGWRALLWIVVSGFVVSYFFTAGTLLYLVARRICDGQGTNEVWNPATDQI